MGYLTHSGAHTERSDRTSKVFERMVPPPIAFLRWLLTHPERMKVEDRTTFGTTSLNAGEWRRKLFSESTALRSEAIAVPVGKRGDVV